MAAIDMATLENLHSEYSHWNADQVKVFFENKDVDLTSCGLPSEFSNGMCNAYVPFCLINSYARMGAHLIHYRTIVYAFSYI